MPKTTRPATKKPATKKPVTKKPVTKKPVTKKPVTKKPVTKKPVMKKSAAPKAAAKKAPAKKPAVERAPGAAVPERSGGGPQHFLIKSEPYVFSFAQLSRDGRAVWDGVRSFEARNNLRAMRPGDRLLFYHSNEGKEIAGVAVVRAAAYPDPTAPGEDWSAVDIAPLCALREPVTLAAIKAEPRLAQINLVRKSRVSVVPVTAAEFALILKMGRTELPTADVDGLRAP
jgi:predicted RNA-binding protein with PUA-like domain